LKDAIELYYLETDLHIGLRIKGPELFQYSKNHEQPTWCLDQITNLKISKQLFSPVLYFFEMSPILEPPSSPALGQKLTRRSQIFFKQPPNETLMPKLRG
tara:strand:+ start:510 stop:809 length:300 start_codon:yes stop_codon:yes gene_type:complete